MTIKVKLTNISVHLKMVVHIIKDYSMEHRGFFRK